ncbi:hypothetical protein [Vreelandella subglaciescola]|uniref:Uncharacterized protein n=1 Tax=Vreelandella subglaciescola TaxID=29571 RepID=A0A1M7FVF5_9GAMM|nr:hypothetical protein [Halomonas subglaciescola]SHM07930.1 hypothetical protein SAMN05878437_1114 [Halomonas subglaciescola]
MAGRTAINASPQEDDGTGHALEALAEFSPPGLTRASQWQRSWRAVGRWVVGHEGEKARAAREKTLGRPSADRLDRWLVPGRGAALAHALQQSLDLAAHPVTFLITPPYGGHAQAIDTLAEAEGLTRLAAPSKTALLNGDMTWMQSLSAQSRWAIPALERHFLRRVDGLQSVRDFLERAQSGALGSGVIGCDSWSYAYLQQAVGLEGVPALTPQALDGEALGDLLAARLSPHCPTLLSSRTQKPLLPDTSGAGGDGRALQRLAANCRGHWGLAWQSFQASLREPGTEDSQADAPLWYVPMQGDAALPADAEDTLLLVLHALLIHGGLDDESLCQVLPFSRHETIQTRLGLTRRGVLCERERRWQVAPLCYTGVRQLLTARHYLVDAL